MAETLITVVILGVIAAITVPQLVRKQVERANKTKVKKAMTVYEKALNQIILSENIKSNQGLAALNNDTCSITTNYFKKVNGENCSFKTADGVWWNIKDIQNPVISLKEKITDANLETMKENAQSLETDKITFSMLGRFDEQGVLRINDNAWEQIQKDTNASTNKKYMAKLYGLLGVEVETLSPIEKAINQYCNCDGEGCCSSMCIDEICIEKLANSTYKYNLNGRIYGSKTVVLHDDGSSEADGSYYSVTSDGMLRMVVNADGNHLSDMVWDKDGNLIKARSSALGYCDKNTCSMNPSPLTAEACQKGHNCYFDSTLNEWIMGGYIDPNWNKKNMENFVSSYTERYNAMRSLGWANYQNAINNK